jgi:hypothetical protein
MPEYDLTDRITEQMTPIVQRVLRRLESELTDRDKAAVGHGLIEAATMGARVAYAQMIANAAEAGIELPDTFSIKGLSYENLWPFQE